MDNQRLHAIVHGRVQGVNFRATTQRRASGLNLRGWVRNRLDGTVEVTAEGARGQLEELRRFLHDGPSAAHVESVETQWQAATGEFDDFRIQ